MRPSYWALWGVWVELSYFNELFNRLSNLAGDPYDPEMNWDWQEDYDDEF